MKGILDTVAVRLLKLFSWGPYCLKWNCYNDNNNITTNRERDVSNVASYDINTDSV